MLDLACGSGRHAVYLAGQGYQVDAVDLDLNLSQPVRDTAGVRWLQQDLEQGGWPFESAAYQGLVVVNYLHRPLFPHLIDALASGGVLIYETFALGQERFGRPKNPAYLLLPGELLELARGRLRVLAYEDLTESEPARRLQRLCAIKP
ncbi:methyltransferase family protein [Sulfuritortus calidifontis]|uniref:Methyltransferase family protein n=1 Tax=Sulfuritortus calidifontis TaxID=1914471 RepID=A0A4R3JYU5_9PROT|nr:methyltransferase family protein [Sulfuritortus calidifontis]